MKKLTLALLFVMLLNISPASALQIIYPQNNQKINAHSVFFTGNTKPGVSVMINGERVKVYDNGSFVHMVSLRPGVNTVNVSSSNKKLTYTLTTPESPVILPQSPLKIDQNSASPKDPVVYRAGDSLQVSFKGATGNKAYFSIGKQRQNIPMFEDGNKGLYKGSYKIQERDVFTKETLIIQLVSEKENISYPLIATVSTIPPDCQSLLSRVTKDYATVRTYPGKSRLTPLPENTILNLTGKIGNSFRFKMGEFLEGWISDQDVMALPQGMPESESIIQNINISSDAQKVYFRIPLEHKPPFVVEQPAPNQMYIKIFGVKAGIDLFSYQNRDKFLKEVKWTQDTKDSVKISITADSKQFWGYKYYYEGDNLVLALRKPPTINPNKPLQDITICIDPGHGGKELGVVGPTGVPEKKVNLEIAMRLQKILQDKGANVIMTRTRDEDVELYSRTKFADYNNAQILISIHNNSLPDGKNPYNDHGTSTYYYHSQSLPLAKILQQAMLDDLGLNDYGIFWDSLVLTRPNESLAVLIETGFMINPDEYALLLKPEFQEKTAASIARGLGYFLFTNTNPSGPQHR